MKNVIDYKQKERRKKNENKNQIQPRRKHQAFGRNFQGLPSLCGEDGKNHRKDGRNRKLKKRKFASR